jgi:hypothetical protein
MARGSRKVIRPNLREQIRNVAELKTQAAAAGAKS